MNRLNFVGFDSTAIQLYKVYVPIASQITVTVAKKNFQRKVL